MNGPERAPATRLVFLVTLWAAFLVFVTTRSTLWEGEPRYAQAAAEMASSGNYLVPHFNGEERLHMPVLAYWLMASSIQAFGLHEWSVRLVGPLGAALAAIATWWIGRRLFDARTATVAAVLFLVCPMVFGIGTVATTDAVLCAATTAAFAAFAAAFVSGWSARIVLALGLWLGLALLDKGPIGLAIPLLGIAGALILARHELGSRKRAWAALGLATLVSVAMFLSWAVPANIATEGRFVEQGLGQHVVGRMVGSAEPRSASNWPSFLYYVPVVILGVLPWIPYLPGAVALLIAGPGMSQRARWLLGSWLATTFVLMSASATKLPHYVLPLFPALALAIAALLRAAETGELDARCRRTLQLGAWLHVPILATLIFACLLVTSRAPKVELAVATSGLAGIFAASAAVCIVLHLKQRWRAGAIASGLGAIAAYVWVALVALPALEPLKLSPRLAAEIRARTPADVPVASYDFDEPSLVFYSRRSPQQRLAGEDELARWIALDRPGVLVTRKESFEEYVGRRGEQPLVELARVRGLNYSKGAWLDLVALGRRLDGVTAQR